MSFRPERLLRSTKTDFGQLRYRLDLPAAIEGLGLEWSDPYRGEVWCPCPLPDNSHRHGGDFSINVTPEHKSFAYYNCFGCGEGGSFLRLVERVLDYTPDEALTWLNDFLKDRDRDDDTFMEEIERLLADTPTEDDPLPHYDSEVIRPYRFTHPWMFEEGLTRDAIIHFQIGYDKSVKGVIFPHFWEGDLVGWQVRRLEGKPKYKSTPNFPKHNTLYNFDGQDQDDVIVVESPKTVGVLWGYGFTNVVATFGAEVTSAQLAHLRPFSRVYAWFDNDDAGRKAVETATQELEKYTDLYLVPAVPKVKGDPADLKADQIQGYLDRAVPSYLREVD